jgi:hypothetical protein
MGGDSLDDGNMGMNQLARQHFIEIVCFMRIRVPAFADLSEQTCNTMSMAATERRRSRPTGESKWIAYLEKLQS